MKVKVLKSFWRQGSGEQCAEDSEDKNVLNEFWRLWRQSSEGTGSEDSEDITSKERVLKILKIVFAEQRSWNSEDWVSEVARLTLLQQASSTNIFEASEDIRKIEDKDGYKLYTRVQKLCSLPR